jgi:hypothetical protein
LNNILAGEQFEYKRDLSTDVALLNFTDEITCARKNKMLVGGISFAIAKAIIV